ncbi:MAG: two-component system, NtrC family, response regulator AtoC [Thermodesulfobacteriota bacterium]|nr:two-component system, NtrC family, response regulator AtoC [Thermodesulfobacteriota bacterium]
MERFKIAVIDDEPIVCREIKRGLSKEGYAVETFSDAESALKGFEQDMFDLVLCDLRLPGLGGLDVLKHIRTHYPQTEVILITGYSSVDSAIEAIRAGAFHYVAKPVKMAEIRLLVKRAMEKVLLVREKEALKEALFSKDRPSEIVGHSRAMNEVFRLIEKVAPLDCNVLIQGESGTGKEMVARALHRQSSRKQGPFVSFNCGGFTEELISNELFGHEKGAFTGANETKIGLLEAAHTGTIFLDEISQMPTTMQVKLLRFVEERVLLRVGGVRPLPVDVRLLAASNQNLADMVKSRTFREDLFYRLNVVAITLPPLRTRRDDIPLLVRYFLGKYSRAFAKEVKGVSSQVMEILSRYPFPGNVRELENIIERAIALSEETELSVRDLPSDLRELSISSLEKDHWLSLEEKEKEYIREVLIKTDYNRNLAAEILGLPRTTLWRKMKRFDLE